MQVLEKVKNYATAGFNTHSFFSQKMRKVAIFRKKDKYLSNVYKGTAELKLNARQELLKIKKKRVITGGIGRIWYRAKDLLKLQKYFHKTPIFMSFPAQNANQKILSVKRNNRPYNGFSLSCLCKKLAIRRLSSQKTTKILQKTFEKAK